MAKTETITIDRPIMVKSFDIHQNQTKRISLSQPGVFIAFLIVAGWKPGAYNYLAYLTGYSGSDANHHVTKLTDSFGSDAVQVTKVSGQYAWDVTYTSTDGVDIKLIILHIENPNSLTIVQES